MKKHFGEYNFLIRKLAKNSAITPQKVADIALARLKQSPRSAERAEDYLIAVSELAVLNGGGTHYFVETEALAEHLCSIGKNYDPRFLEIIEDEGRALGVIHTCGQKAKAVLFAWNKDSKTLVVGGEEAKEIYHGQSPGETRAPAVDTQLLFGLCLYLTCFPEAIRDGFPEFAKHPAHYKGDHCAAVGSVPQIIERSGPHPHFRNGHYRILRSERFTKKRWQVVFVHEAFVKGKVKTVTEVEPKPREEQDL